MLCAHPSPSNVTTTAISPRHLRASATFLEAPETHTYIAMCYGLSVCYLTTQFHIGKLNPIVTVLRDGAFGRKLGERDRVLMNGICAFIRKDTDSLAFFLLFLPCEDIMRRQLSANQEEGPHQIPDLLAL